MGSTIEDLIEYVLSWERRERLADVRIGLGYTAVQLSSGKCGVACTLRHRLHSGHCALLSQAGTFVDRAVTEIVPLVRSQNVVEAAIGLATINALADQNADVSSTGEIWDLLQITAHDRVGMIGDIAPVVQKLKPRAREVFVFDEAKSGMEGILESSKEAKLLPLCDVVILSATSLLNQTYDSLLTVTTQARARCLMGPSTPLLPDFFRSRGMTLLAGRQVLDAHKLLQIVSEAGGTPRFYKVTRKVNILLK